MRGVLSLILGAVVVTSGAAAMAQDVSSGSAAQTGGSSGGGGSITDTTGATDHSQVVGHLGLRYFGSTQVPVLAGGGSGLPQWPGAQVGVALSGASATGVQVGSATMHTVGVRYWLSNSLALEGGLSLGFSSGSTTTTEPQAMGGTRSVTNDDPNFFGIGFTVGTPILLADSKHLSINLTPLLYFNYGSSSITRGDNFMNARDESSSAVVLGVGANAAAELHFGFLGIPQLALQAQIGLQLRYRTVTVQTVPRATNLPSSATQNAFGLGTTVGPNYGLADIITGAISVVYYFGR